MSWDIVLFNSTQKIDLIENVDENQLVAIDFTQILENSFSEIIMNANHREIKGNNFSIDFFNDKEMTSNKMVSVYGENGLFELIKLSKKHGWQIFDTGFGKMIDLNNPEKNGFENYKNYIANLMKK